VATKPGLIPEVLLTLVTGLDVLLQILTSDRALDKYIPPYKPHQNLLENGTIRDLVDGVVQEFRCRMS
jgi:hypothetical protein